MRRGDDMLLAWLTAGWLIPAILLSAIELSGPRTLGPSVIGLDSVAGALLPFGLLSLYFTLRHGPVDSPPSDPDDNGGGGGGGGGGCHDLPPNPPSGGLEIDWDAFEADLRAWSEARQVLA